MGDNRLLGPWRQIGQALEQGGEPAVTTGHPSPATLRQYLAGQLPERPERWSKERAEALASGELADWSSWELVAHLAGCPSCKRSLEDAKQRCVGRPWLSRTWLLERVRGPALARLGWVLAGGQAAALAALLIWIATFQPSPVSPKPIDLPTGLSGMDVSSSGTPVARIARVRFAAEATVLEVSELIEGLGISIYGPDGRGYDELVLAQGLEIALADLAIHPLIEDLELPGER